MNLVRRHADRHSGWPESLQSLLGTVVIAVFVVTFVVQAFQIPSESMENTLLIGDYLLVDKLHFGNDGFWGIYAANDDTGGGAIAALKGAGLNPEERPVTGQDSTVAGLQRILAKQQYMTIYKAITPQAKIAAEFALALAEGEELPQSKVTEEINNGKADVPSAILEPVAVTKDNVKSTVVADGFVSASELCTGPYVAACKEAGISG